MVDWLHSSGIITEDGWGGGGTNINRIPMGSLMLYLLNLLKSYISLGRDKHHYHDLDMNHLKFRMYKILLEPGFKFICITFCVGLK